jgi:hypothetical protein
MTFQPIPGEPLAVSSQAKGVMQAAAAKRKPAGKRTRTTGKPALNRTEVIYRDMVRRELLAGGNPHHHDPVLVEALEQADPAVGQAVDAWYDRHMARHR